MTAICPECGLPDIHGGEGDGIGSCDCPRCEYCGLGPWCRCWASDRDDYESDCDWAGFGS